MEVYLIEYWVMIMNHVDSKGSVYGVWHQVFRMSCLQGLFVSLDDGRTLNSTLPVCILRCILVLAPLKSQMARSTIQLLCFYNFVFLQFGFDGVGAD
jgi:hypothetical protein